MNAELPVHNESVEELQDQVHESRSRVMKIVLLTIGTICVALGILGIVLPILPTTPFLLLAAICYSHSSERFYIALLSNRFFGHYIRDWRENRGLSLTVKLWVIFVLLTTMGISIVFFIPLLSIKIACIIVGTVITVYIWMLPTKTEILIKKDGE